MRLIYLALVSVLLSGCGGEEFQDLRDFVKNSGADMRGKIEPPPEVKPYEYFAYNNETNLPNPFKPRKQDARAGGGSRINQPDSGSPQRSFGRIPARRSQDGRLSLPEQSGICGDTRYR